MSHRLMRSAASVIRDLRKLRNQTQEDLAAASGLDRTYISGVERGARNITLDSLEQIVLAMQIPLDEFVSQWKAKLKKDGVEIKNAQR